MARLAHVYICDIPYHADKPYTYSVPDFLAMAVSAGSMVEVPFGSSNRSVSGIVFELSEGDAGGRIKDIKAVMGDEPLLDGEQIGLCMFIKEHTLCTFGDALHAVVPVGALTKIGTYYRVSDVIPAETVLSNREKTVLEILKKGKKTQKSSIQKLCDFDVTPTLSKLIESGTVEKFTEKKAGSSIKTVRDVSLTDSAKKDFDCNLLSLRGENQKTLFAFLKDAGTVSESFLFGGCSLEHQAGKTALSALAKKGFVTVHEREEIRNHFIPENFDFSSTAFVKPVLSPSQQNAADTIKDMCDSGVPGAVLIHGVTGSGKTNVILEAIDHSLENGRGVIMLVPEIALTPQTVGIFLRRYGDKIAVIHSALSTGERYDAWRRIKDGGASVVIGTRSAVFAPMKNIGMIVIDEEQEYTYKSDTDPKYLAHDIARYRCKEHNSVMVLASATPSVTSYYKAKTGAYRLIELKERYGNATLPSVEIYDMRGMTAAGNLSPVGELLADKLREDKASGNQAIVFLNRRGYNNYVACTSCGKSLKCPNCSVTLTYHSYKSHASKKTDENYEEDRRRNGYLICHTCGYRSKVPEKCPDCDKEHFMFMGCGTQKAEDEIISSFPDLRVLRMDYDTTQAKFSHEEILNRFRRGEADVLLGTQMVTKGHDFPRVATVGVLSADASFTVDDYRAGERTFAMLTQVIGRAGRADVKGCAVIQTFDPANEIITLAAKQDYVGFYENEIKMRKAAMFPPYCDIAVLTLASDDENSVFKAADIMKKMIVEKGQNEYADIAIQLFGPFEAPIYRIQNTYRMRFVIKCRLNKRTREFISDMLVSFGKDTGIPGAKKKISVSADLNPSTV